MWKMAVSLNVFFCLLRGLAAPSPTQAAELMDRIVAFVNDDIITMSELNEKTNAFLAARQKNPFVREQDQSLDKIRRDILENLINERLAAREIARLKISVSEAELDEVVANIRQENHLTQETLEAQLHKEGMTLADLRQKIRADMERTTLINREVRNKTVITDEQVRQYYQSHPAEFQEKLRHRLRDIFLPLTPEATPGERSQVQAQAEQILSRLRLGADFAAMARRYSKGPGAEEGGDLGFFSKGELDPNVQNAIEDLGPGDISPVIATGMGLHIIKVMEVEKTTPKPLEEVRESIRRQLFQQEINRKYVNWLQSLRDRSYVKIDY
jgi:peptidyl-prolyl cis-trans isomerase SurA